MCEKQNACNQSFIADLTFHFNWKEEKKEGRHMCTKQLPKSEYMNCKGLFLLSKVVQLL